MNTNDNEANYKKLSKDNKKNNTNVFNSKTI